MRTRALLQRLKISLIDRYIVSEIVSPFLGGVLFFTFVFLMFQALRLADFFIIHGVSIGLLIEMVFYLALSFLPMILPLAFLIAILLGFGRLSSESELVAMKSSGISLKRLSIPVFGVSLGVVIISLLLNLNWVPWSGRAFRSLLLKITNTKAVSSIKEGTFTPGFFDLLLYADKADSRTNRLQRLFIFDEREPKNPLIVVAQEGRVVPVRNQNALGASAVLNLTRGNIHKNDIESETYQRINFQEYNLYLSIEEGEEEKNPKPKTLPYRTVVDRLNYFNSTPKLQARHTSEITDLKTELWRRYSFGISPVVFVLLGIGFGTFRTRSVKSGAAAISFVVILIYWALQILGTTLSFKGTLPPWLAMQTPNLIIFILGWFAYRKSSW
jgi:LPS export ABC transporter permease LptF